MEITRIIAEIKKERPDAKAVFFVGCGASKAEPVSYTHLSRCKYSFLLCRLHDVRCNSGIERIGTSGTGGR